MLSLFIFGYSYGSVITINCCYDKSAPEMFNAKILDKRIKSGKENSWRLHLSPWDSLKEAHDAVVSKKLYDQLEHPNEVTVQLKNGLFGIPCFFITPKEY